MRYLFLPFFLIILSLRAAPSLFQLLVVRLLPHRAFLFTLGLLVVAGYYFYRNLININIIDQAHKNPLLAEQQAWETLLKKQPDHRDILLNLSAINASLGNQTNAHSYWQRAASLDPNNELVKNAQR